jgi:hypothetical protein
MTWLEAAVWGVFGGFAVEGLEFVRAIRRTGGWPWRQVGEPGLFPLATSVVIRLVVGGGLAVATVAAGQVQGPFGALAVGVAAPLLIEQILGYIPVRADASAASAETRTAEGPAVPACEQPAPSLPHGLRKPAQVVRAHGEDGNDVD